MYSNSGTLYPMLGVGSFMAMFWTGIVLGYELGLGCMSLLILGLLSSPFDHQNHIGLSIIIYWSNFASHHHLQPS